ncbi:site-specific integrase [Bacillus subtilis]|uniref:tyrosine-type recombinase/integrase n=1 Tax=Bacillus subtilis TaxID=1423 RepID=UPI0021B0E621|nr:site-specific integrase [Bacillus subtilis]MCY7813487.1 site-specific integrase [Bacillus spizizenii]MCT6511948.1 site-specific integrase [Bacillus subtilis]MCY8051775.1 site-specific integrase [Bacillus spizizenii]MEC0292440.1 tyrosine-type recombinase/integrase [Bacillus subtilis]MEC0334504.1 tyrosine-type recombinase/integrase [Bacillus subtilis]
MPVYKDKKTNTYFFTTRVQREDGSVKQARKRGFKTKKAAKEAEAKFLIEIDDSSDITFKEAADSYFAWYRARRKESSVNVIKNILFNHLIHEFGNAQVDSITPKKVMLYQSKIIDKFAPDFLKKIHTTLSAVFNFSIKFHGTKNNPAKIAGNFEMEVNKRLNYWEFDEFKKFISVVDDELYRAFFTTLYFSGARKGEMLALTWADVDFENNLIDINKTEYNRIVTTPKTKSSIRINPMPQKVMELLKGIKKSAEKIAPVKPEYRVFGSFYDSIATSTIDRRYEKYLKLSGVKRILIHEFRHSHASYLIHKRCNPLVIAQRLGHKNVAETLNTYSHLYPSAQKEIVELMDKENF